MTRSRGDHASGREPLDLLGRVRAIARDGRLLVGGTVAVLLLVVPLGILVALVATGNATDAGGVVLLVMLVAGGAYAVFDVLAQAGQAAATQAVPGAAPRRRPVLRIVGATLALLVLFPLAVALVMSNLEPWLHGNRPAAKLVVGGIVAVALVLATWLVRLAVGRRAPTAGQDGAVGTTSERLARRIRQDFAAADVPRVLEVLRTVPEGLPLGERQDAERVQAALVLPAHGDLARFTGLAEAAARDWRDVLVGAGLAHAGWSQRLDAELGPA